MNEFKFDPEEVDTQAVRIMQKLLPELSDENIPQITATLVLMLGSYITIMSSGAEIGEEETLATVDKVATKLKRIVREQRAHLATASKPGHA